jgi:hypothetical protein
MELKYLDRKFEDCRIDKKTVRPTKARATDNHRCAQAGASKTHQMREFGAVAFAAAMQRRALTTLVERTSPVARVMRGVAAAGIAFQTTQPPGPFSSDNDHRSPRRERRCRRSQDKIPLTETRSRYTAAFDNTRAVAAYQAYQARLSWPRRSSGSTWASIATSQNF